MAKTMTLPQWNGGLLLFLYAAAWLWLMWLSFNLCSLGSSNAENFLQPIAHWLIICIVCYGVPVIYAGKNRTH